MTQTLTIYDETALGKVLNRLLLEVQQEAITIANLIRLRVTQEVNDYNHRATEHFNGLVQPTNTEQTLNGYELRQRRKLDADKQVATALQAFEQNGFFILVDNRQVETLDEEILLTETTSVSFIKLTPLVGG